MSCVNSLLNGQIGIAISGSAESALQEMRGVRRGVLIKFGPAPDPNLSKQKVAKPSPSVIAGDARRARAAMKAVQELEKAKVAKRTA